VTPPPRPPADPGPGHARYGPGLGVLIVPSLMFVFDRANWWIPAWLERVLPRLEAGPTVVPTPDPEPESIPMPPPSPSPAH
jgi:RND superfamily putative drug exporter